MKFKTFYRSLALAIISFTALNVVRAQDYHSTKFNGIKTGVGPVFFGSGDILGIMQYTEYNRQVLPALWLSAGFSLAQGASTTDRWQQAAAKALDFNVNLLPVHSQEGTFKVGLGLSRRYLTDIYSIGSSSYPRGNSYVMVEEFARLDAKAWGYTALLEYEYNFYSRWLVGTRASFQNYQIGSTVIFLGLNGGVRF